MADTGEKTGSSSGGCLAGQLTVSRTFPLSPPCLCSRLCASEKALCSLQKAASHCILSADAELPCSHSPSSIMSLDLSNFLQRSSVSQNLAIMGSLNNLWEWEISCLPRSKQCRQPKLGGTQVIVQLRVDFRAEEKAGVVASLKLTQREARCVRLLHPAGQGL